MSTDAQVLVIGSGPAGITAAATAAMHGMDVLLLDDNAAPGGQIWRESIVGQPEEPDDMQRKALLALRVSGARIFSGWSVFDAPRERTLRAIQDTGSDTHTIDISYENLILATGARERFLPFPGWTLPGVFGAGGLQALARGGFPVAGKRIVVAGTGPLLLPVAAHLRQMGGRVTTVAEQASRRQLARFSASLSRQPGKLLEGLQYRAASGGSRYRLGCWPVAALGTEKLEGVRLTDGERTWDEPSNLLACGFHLVPNTELASLLGCTLRDANIEVDEVQQTSIANVFAAGEPTGIAGLDSALLTGTMAGLAAAGKLDEARGAAAAPEKVRAICRASQRRLRPAPRAALARPARYNRLPLRRCPLRRTHHLPKLERSQAADTMWHGPVPGSRMRTGNRSALRLAHLVRAAAAHHPFRFPQ